MRLENQKPAIVVAEDDEDDFFFLREAMMECFPSVRIHWVKDGEELMRYLSGNTGEGEPQLILLDLNMPKKDGRETLREIKTNPELCHIPVVVLTTSNAVDDVMTAYQLGGSSFIRKPSDYKGLQKFVQTFETYWFELSYLPVLTNPA